MDRIELEAPVCIRVKNWWCFINKKNKRELQKRTISMRIKTLWKLNATNKKRSIRSKANSHVYSIPIFKTNTDAQYGHN